jgi:hypothetical protein
MRTKSLWLVALTFCVSALLTSPGSAQIGRRFPSEKNIVTDPVTGTPLTFLTSTPAGDSKIYQTHQQWTADGKWLVFCWETGGKAPQRTWTVMADGTGLRPLYPEASYDWITHEAVITKDEVAIAILAHRRPGVPETDPWGVSSTGEHPSGVGIVNLRTREMRIIGQAPMGNPGRSIWHVNGSPDGRWAVADDFRYRLWLIRICVPASPNPLLVECEN